MKRGELIDFDLDSNNLQIYTRNPSTVSGYSWIINIDFWKGNSASIHRIDAQKKFVESWIGNLRIKVNPANANIGRLVVGYCNENPTEEGTISGQPLSIPENELDVIWEIKREAGKLILSCNDQVVFEIVYSDVEKWLSSCKKKYGSSSIRKISFRAEGAGAMNDEASQKYRVSPVSPEMLTGM